MTVRSMALIPGFVLDRFSVDEVIATGTSAIIYRVSDTLTGSPFMLYEHVPAGPAGRNNDGLFMAADEQSANDLSLGVARFLANAAGAAALHHPNIAGVSRWFKANGTAYLVMPWLTGRSLAALLESRRKLTAQQSLGIALAVMDALEYLHAQQIVHQEIGPEFIFVPETGSALLLGCGVTTGPNSASGIMASGDAGRAYVAIEQLRSELKTGPWTDIYALAATLYHCVTGTVPPTADQRRAAVEAHQADPLAHIKTAADDSQWRREVITLITRGIALDPSSRPQSVREWRARLSRLPAAAERRTTDSGGRHALEGRQRLPAVLLGVFFLVAAAIAAYLFLDRTNVAVTTDASPSPPATGKDWASSQETERWRQALEANAVVGYRAFIADFPQSVHLAQAQEHIDQLEDKAWEQVVAENTKAGYEAHLSGFPQGRHATEALSRIDEFNREEARLAREREAKLHEDDMAWEAAKAAGSLAGLDSYIAAWPGGSHVGEARDLRQKLQYQLNDTAGFEAAAKQHTIAAFRSYIGDFPDGRHVATAREAIESLTLRPGKTFQDCSDCPMMVVVPAGAFWQGAAEASPLAISIEKPRRRVVIAEPFAAGVYEITMAQWDACAATGGCDTRPSDNGWGRGKRPVMMVSWNDATQYAAWISARTGQSYSLPSESQWEYLARAGEEGDWLDGNAADICRFGNIAGNETGFDWRHKDCTDGSALTTTPAGSYQPNAFGLYDVIGNVAEWTLDCMNLSYLEAPADGSAWSRGMCSSRMTRGGSWFTGTKESRLSARFNLKNGDRNDFTGFRLVRRIELQ